MDGSPGRLQDKVAIVTGSSSGIGRAIALRFAHEGAHVVCADIRDASHWEHGGETEMNITTHELIGSNGGRAVFVATDVTNSDDMEHVIESTVEEFGKVDIMVNNAGVNLEIRDRQPIWNVAEQTWDIVNRVNAKGVFLGCKYASAQMLTQNPNQNGDRGWIINVASILGLVGLENLSSYCAAKGAVVNLTRAAALDCAPARIHVNAICPGFTATAMTDPVRNQVPPQALSLDGHPFRGSGIPDDVARAAVFLASEDAGWITGSCIPVDGGYTAR